MKYRVISFLLFIVIPGFSQEKLLERPEALEIVKKGLFHIYNTETVKAERYISQVDELMPRHPVTPMMRALNINWSANPIESNTEEFRKLIGFLQLSLDRTRNYLKADQQDLEAIFFAMIIHGWLAQFYDEDGLTFKAVNSAKKAYQYMKIGFELLDQNNEFYFSTGMYNYYRVQYPQSNPIYKPFVWFFRDGDKELGLNQLDYASKNAVFTRAEASMYLAHIYLRYENQPKLAVNYSKGLVDMFPRNTFFKITYTEALLAAGQYTKAYVLVQALLMEEKDYYRMSGELFYGWYFEKHLSDLRKAKIWYNQCLKTGEDIGARAENKLSLAHAGLARIAAANGQTEEAREHYKTAMKLAQYDGVKNEAKSYLRED